MKSGGQGRGLIVLPPGWRLVGLEESDGELSEPVEVSVELEDVSEISVVDVGVD